MLTYHGLALRADQKLVPPDEAVATGSPVERRALTLVGPPAELDVALAAARAALPGGVELVAET